LLSDERLANLRMDGNARRRRRDVGHADRGAHVLALEQHLLPVERDSQARREVCERRRFVEADRLTHGSQGDGAIHRPGVEVREAQRRGDGTGHG
jgi:hypothetical protein